MGLEVAVKNLSKIIAVVAVPSSSMATSAVAAEQSRKLSGAQIRPRFTGIKLTDEVHYRDVYDRDGTLRSYSMGTKKVGKWAVEKDETLSILQGTGRWLLRSVVLGEPH